MIAKEVKGRNLRGLVEYLYGRGKAEQHADPHLVAAWDQQWLDRPGAGHDKAARGMLTNEMQAPERIFGVEAEQGNVYHVPISIHPRDGKLTDEQWRQIAEAAVDKLGFSQSEERAGCRWAAVRHGLGGSGQDHIHLVVNRVRDNGTVASVQNDHIRLSELRAEMEAYFELTPTNSRGAGSPAVGRGEAEAAARRGRSEPERRSLARTVRAAAHGANHEADFVYRMRREGLLVRPFWAKGSRSQVVGYSVAHKPDPGADPVWYGGGKLSRDLSLPALRQRWGEPTAEQHSANIREWRPRRWRRAGPGQPEAPALRAEAWDHAQQVVAEARTQLAGVAPGDGATWASAAREAAGTLSGLADRVGGARGRQLAEAADACARAAQLEPGGQQPGTGHRGGRAPEVGRLAGVARVATDTWIAGRPGSVGTAQLITQLQRLSTDIGKAHTAAGRAARARHAETATTQMQEYLHALTPAQTQPQQTRPAAASLVQPPRVNDPGRSSDERGR